MFLDPTYFGPLRIILLVLLAFTFNKYVFKYQLQKDKINFFVRKFMKYGSVLYLLTIFLNQIGHYDMFLMMLVIIIIIISHHLGIRFRNVLKLKNIANDLLLEYIKDLENSYLKSQKPKLLTHKNYMFIHILFLVNIALIVSVLFYFFNYDVSSSTTIWVEDLIKTDGFQKGFWFSTTNEQFGDYPFISLYANFMGLTPELALKTFGLLEITLLSIVVFWLADRLTKGSFILSSIAMLVVVFLLIYYPVSTSAITFHHSMYLSLSIAIPLMVYTLEQQERIYKSPVFAYKYTLIFLTVFFINLSTALIVLPIYFVLVFVIKDAKKTLVFFVPYILSIVSGCVLVSIFSSQGLGNYLRTNLISLNSFYEEDYLLQKLSVITNVYLGVLLMMTIVVAIAAKKLKTDRRVLLILVFTVAVFALSRLDNIYVDKDSLSIILRVFAPLSIIVLCFFLYKYIVKKPWLVKYKNQAVINTLFSALLVFVYYNFHQKIDKKKYQKINTTNQVLKVYNKILTQNLPNTYMVINNNDEITIHSTKHESLYYQDFVENYLDKDSIYQKYKEVKKVMRENPNYGLPSSVFVFEYPTEATKNEFVMQQKSLDSILQVLNQRNRMVLAYYQQEGIKVYEIVNKKNASKINSLMFQ
ncbi:hypothetical protein ACXGQW_01635 [Wenyingzhuangia sp. IMCC45533]